MILQCGCSVVMCYIADQYTSRLLTTLMMTLLHSKAEDVKPGIVRDCIKHLVFFCFISHERQKRMTWQEAKVAMQPPLLPKDT